MYRYPQIVALSINCQAIIAPLGQKMYRDKRKLDLCDLRASSLNKSEYLIQVIAAEPIFIKHVVISRSTEIRRAKDIGID